MAEAYLAAERGVLSQDEVNEIDLAAVSAARAQAVSEPPQASFVVPSEQPADNSWLRVLLLGMGGLLTLGSVVRLFV